MDVHISILLKFLAVVCIGLGSFSSVYSEVKSMVKRIAIILGRIIRLLTQVKKARCGVSKG